ncbi:MAG: septum formation family protein [Nocardioidaceae bacterium]
MTDSLAGTARLICAVAIVLALLSGCSPSPSATATSDTQTSTSTNQPTTPPTTPEPSPPPDTGTCRDLNFGDINRYSNTTATTPCQRPHTAYTFAATTLPKDIAFEGVAIKNDAVQQAAADSCRAKFTPYVGGDAATRALVRLTVTYFLPDQRSFDAGAHWVRCDIIALQAEKILAELPSKLRGALDNQGIVDDFALCSGGEPGTAASVMVTCNQPHAYRAVAALRLGGTEEAYPGEAVTLDDGRRRCEDLIKADVGADGGYTFSWTYPTAADWQAGQRFGYCWNKTTR